MMQQHCIYGISCMMKSRVFGLSLIDSGVLHIHPYNGSAAWDVCHTMPGMAWHDVAQVIPCDTTSQHTFVPPLIVCCFAARRECMPELRRPQPSNGWVWRLESFNLAS